MTAPMTNNPRRQPASPFRDGTFTTTCNQCKQPITYVDGKITEGCRHQPAAT